MLDNEVNSSTPLGSTSPGAQQPPTPSIYDLEGLKGSIGDVTKRATNILDPFKELEASGERLTETFGFAGERLREMETQINRSATGILEVSKRAMTYEAALKRAGEIVNEVATITSRNVIASTEVIKGLELTSEATGVSTKDLAEKFSDVGFQLSDVKDQMEIAAKTAQKLGVNVSAVAKEVTANLGKMNVYNFQNGVEGLAKMAAKSSVLGVEMQKVFDLAERAFDPEKAINLAADMQRLGVATSDLLDPLKIMDLGQNNPEELMKQVVNVTKGLTKLDEVSGKVSILPGEQGRLRELAEALGMSKEELAKMAIKSGELEYKMKKISFPTLKAPISEDDREMIANLAQFDTKAGGFVVTLKDKEGDERKELVSKLNPDDIAFLKEQATPKSLEKLAEDQLTVSQKMLKELELLTSAPRAGLSRTKGAGEMKTTMDAIADASMNASFKKTKNEETGQDEDIHDVAERTLGTIGGELAQLPLDIAEAIQKSLKEGDIEGAKNAFNKLGERMIEVGGKATAESVTFTQEAFKKVSDALGAAVTTLKTKEKPTTVTATSTTPESSLNWHETLDATMEQYKNSMNSQTITTPTEKTPEQIKEDENKKDLEAMEELLTAYSQPKETPGLNMSPVIDNGIAQTDRLIERVDLLIDAVKESKFEMDYDKLKIQEKGDENYTSIFEPIVNKLNDLVLVQEKIIGIKSPEPIIVENKETKTTEIIKEKDIVEVKPESPKIPETDFSSLIGGFASNNDKLINSLTELKNNLSPEPTIVENKEIKTNEIIKEKDIVEIKPEITTIPEFDTNSIVSSMSNQTDKFVDNINSLKETTKQNKMDFDYDKLKVPEKGEENYASIFEPMVNKLNDFVSTQEKIIGSKSPEPTIVENKEVIIENNKIETEKKQNEPLFSNENKTDDKQVTDSISLISENFLAKLEQFKEEKNKTIDFDYEKFNVNFSSKEKGKENLFDLESRLKDLTSKIEQKNIASNDTKPIPTREGITDKKIEAEDKVAQTKIETPEIKPFDFGPLTQTINLMSDKLSNNQLSIKDFKPENKLEFNYQEFASKLPNDKNYGEILNPLSNKISSLITSTESQISGIKNFEPKTVEKKEFKETFIKENSPVAEIPNTEKIILPELNVKDKNFESLPKITESKIPESAVRTNAEMSPVTMKTESTTNVGGEITLVVDVRGVQNDSSRLIIDEVTKKINSGEFTTALIGQIKNKESAYGQLSGNQSSVPPGFA